MGAGGEELFDNKSFDLNIHLSHNIDGGRFGFNLQLCRAIAQHCSRFTAEALCEFK